ncbi:hypothetical protein SLEP1_g15185 [Rubroshorea leprosula]|uniref:Uncharacterized protein n=1 Tax=Rubroshorea leprosula TaxID=152421 RepID=A0AAV5IW15_9ROSI|nr:hypothetical protein SLEP1_g15185 [Rubroshorea leprosula]
MKVLIDEFDKALRFVSYQVRSCDGKANGVLLEDDDEYSGSIKYPSLDDFYSPAPQQSYCPSPVPVLDWQRHGFYRPSLAEVPPPYWVAHGAYSASIPHGFCRGTTALLGGPWSLLSINSTASWTLLLRSTRTPRIGENQGLE